VKSMTYAMSTNTLTVPP
jgi:hypothetical protein